MSYSNIQLRNLAQQNPKELIRIITSSGGDAKTLSSGVEVLGEEVTNETLVIPVLRQLLKHPHALVREGALNGAAAFFSDKIAPREIIEIIRNISKNDPLSINKDFASHILSDFDQAKLKNNL
jgi:hypothetical protein